MAFKNRAVASYSKISLSQYCNYIFEKKVQLNFHWRLASKNVMRESWHELMRVTNAKVALINDKTTILRFLTPSPKIIPFPCIWCPVGTASEICQKRQNWRFSGKSTSKSGNTVKFGNFGILAISAALLDDSNSKSPKIGKKRQYQWFLGKIHIQIW